MASPAQIAANQRNAQKSTGPRSAEGKAASSFNALKHGLDAQSVIIPGEDPVEYEALAAHYLHEHDPQTPTESFHLQTMLRADWQKRRLQLLEADLHRILLTESGAPSLAAALLADSPAARLLFRTQRQIAALERTFYRALNQLQRGRRDPVDLQVRRELALLEAALPPSPRLASFPQNPAPPPPLTRPVRPNYLVPPPLPLPPNEAQPRAGAVHS